MVMALNNNRLLAWNQQPYGQIPTGYQPQQPVYPTPQPQQTFGMDAYQAVFAPIQQRIQQLQQQVAQLQASRQQYYQQQPAYYANPALNVPPAPAPAPMMPPPPMAPVPPTGMAPAALTPPPMLPQQPGYSQQLQQPAYQQPSTASIPTRPDQVNVAGAPMLQNGDTSDAVRQLQDRLRSLGLNPGDSDGEFGPQTEAAVRAFQQRQGIEVDGVVGPSTWQHLAVPGGVSTAQAVAPAPAPQVPQTRPGGRLVGTSTKDGNALPNTSGRATTFWNGRESYKGVRDTGNASKGAWGDPLHPTDYYVALPVGLKGGASWWHNQKILITNPQTGKQVVALVQDKGPAPWTHNAIDMSPVAKEALGVSFQTNLNVQIAFAPDNAPVGPVN